jgi:hypothetical protein
VLNGSTGQSVAQAQLDSGLPSTGYATLQGVGRLDLTLEALVIMPLWRTLFTSIEIATARSRLLASNFAMPFGS